VRERSERQRVKEKKREREGGERKGKRETMCIYGLEQRACRGLKSGFGVKQTQTVNPATTERERRVGI
jgi:hypothetical protein